MLFNIKLSIFYQSVVIHDHAKDDIRDIAKLNKNAAATLLALLQQLKVDPNTTIGKLTTYGDNNIEAHHLSVKPWEKVKGIGNLWRFRILDSPATNHRVIYGYHYQTRQLCILAVVNKDDYDYDDLTSEINQRIISDWKSI